jgi:plasmid stability protein
MPGMTITVRGLEAELHRRLKDQAKAHGRSMESEARAILAAGVGLGAVDFVYRGTIPDVTVEPTAPRSDPGLLGTRIRELFASVWEGEEYEDWVPARGSNTRPPVSFE